MNDAQRASLAQFVKYAMVGVLNTCVTLIVIFVCKSLLGVNPYLSNLIGYICGIINSFVWNRNWVFRANGRVGRQILLFALGTGVCYSLQFVALWLLTQHTSLREMQWLICGFTLSGYGAATLLASVVYTLCNFIYNKLVAFKK